MGSKRSLAPAIGELISARHPDAIILDAFSGMCAVGTEVSAKHTLYTNDIHLFAETIARALFVAQEPKPTSLNAKDELTDDINENAVALKNVFSKDVSDEEIAIARAMNGQWSRLRRLYEDASNNIYPISVSGMHDIVSYRDNPNLFPYCLFVRYFTQGYFSFQQAIEIDSIRYAISKSSKDRRAFYLAALLQAVSHCSASSGHFAQFLAPRDSKNTKYIARIRSRSVLERFWKALDEFRLPDCLDRSRNKTFQRDAVELLDAAELHDQNLVIYADPPYSRAQYSRYYHVLETLVLYDYPECTGKGRYRNGRFNTGFSRKTSVVGEFDKFLSRAAELGAETYISYPTNGLLEKVGHKLYDIMSEYFTNVERVEHTLLQHSTLGGAPGSSSVPTYEEIYYASGKKR
ncbi:MAG: DNA adenine methylase [Parasphingopyxis sp.]|uniref:DNA adenine methylase n=1 Tax=Parasphingopyxis sp. TaxID=1920299 RepID=UPI003FA0D8A0